MSQFVQFVRKHIAGDEKRQAQLFCDRLFQAFGHPGIREAGGPLEFRTHKGNGTGCADLIWKPRVLIEMKKRGEKLERHYRQAFEHWLDLVPNRPRFVVLCNFDAFWVYDLNHQLDEPMNRVELDELPERYTALNFLFPRQERPLFTNDRVAVTGAAAQSVAEVFNRLVARRDRPISRERAQRFVLQCVLALFAEDLDLLPRGLFTELVGECVEGGSSSDLIGGLFRQMGSAGPAGGGRFKDVACFNGDLFKTVEPIELTKDELAPLAIATNPDWSKVHPAIFGSLFEGSMADEERRAYGAHFTSEVDIQKVVLPTIVRPWRERITAATTATELQALRKDLLSYLVLDPACGSGNFLYVAYRELKRIEIELLEKICDNCGPQALQKSGGTSPVSASQFFGIDIKPFAVELAKVTLMLATRLATARQHLPLDLGERPPPPDNLDDNFIIGDALLDDRGGVRAWPAADVIIGNPPFIGSKRLKPLRGADYVNRLRKTYQEVPGLADYCVFWVRRTHDHLPACTPARPTSGRAGLVGTQNVRNNKSREGGLDHLVGTGTILEAVDNQPWPAEADVHVSIINWVKTRDPELLPRWRRLWTQANPKATRSGKRSGNGQAAPLSDLVFRDTEFINSSLSDETDVSGKNRLACNASPKRCFQGKIPGYDGFLVGPDRAEELRVDSATVTVPYLTGRELLGEFRIERWAIDFGNRDLIEAAAFRSAFEHCQQHVRSGVEASYLEAVRTGSDMAEARREHLQRWWQFWNRRDELSAVLRTLPRYIGCSRVTRRPIMVFLSAGICPSDLVQVFALADDYSFGILQSACHFEWFRKSSRLKVESDTRYSVREVFETFPWPQTPSPRDVQEVVEAARSLRSVRQIALSRSGGGLRALYRTLDLPGKNPLRDAHLRLDEAVWRAYGMQSEEEDLAFLLEVNRTVSAREAAGQPVERPGLPSFLSDSRPFHSDDYLSP